MPQGYSERAARRAARIVGLRPQIRRAVLQRDDRGHLHSGADGTTGCFQYERLVLDREYLRTCFERFAEGCRHTIANSGAMRLDSTCEGFPSAVRLECTPMSEARAREQLSEHEARFGPNSPDILDSVMDLSLALLANDKAQEARRVIDRMISIAEDHLSANDERVVLLKDYAAMVTFKQASPPQHALRAQYEAWALQKGEMARKPRAAFLGWVKKFTKGKVP